MKIRTNLPLHKMLMKQSRLIFVWTHFFLTALFYIITMFIAASRDYSDEDHKQYIREYEDCVLADQDDHDCQLEGVIFHFVFLLFRHLIIDTFPITIFFFIGFRKYLILFWWEYLKYVWVKKRIPLAFVPYFDQGISSSSVNEKSGSTSVVTFARRMLRQL